MNKTEFVFYSTMAATFSRWPKLTSQEVNETTIDGITVDANPALTPLKMTKCRTQATFSTFRLIQLLLINTAIDLAFTHFDELMKLDNGFATALYS